MSKTRNRFLRFSFITLIFFSSLFGMNLEEVDKIGDFIIKQSQDGLEITKTPKKRFQGKLYKHLTCISNIGEYCLYKDGRKQYLFKKKQIEKKYYQYNILVERYIQAIEEWKQKRYKKDYNYRLDVCGNVSNFYPFESPIDCYKLFDLSDKKRKIMLENYLFTKLKNKE